MSTPQDYSPYAARLARSPIDRALLREIVAALLVFVGVAALVIVAFLVDPHLGVAVLAVVFIAAGVLLGIDR